MLSESGHMVRSPSSARSSSSRVVISFLPSLLLTVYQRPPLDFYQDLRYRPLIDTTRRVVAHSST